MNIIELIKNGHQSFADNIKILLYQYDNEIFTKLDFEDDSIYTDPLFFAIFNNNDYKAFSSDEMPYLLNTLIFGYSSSSTFRKTGVKVLTDNFGRVYIPKYGWLVTNFKNTLIDIREDEEIVVVEFEGNRIECNTIKPQFIKGTSIETMMFPHKLFEQFFPPEIYSEIDFEKIASLHLDNLNKSFNIIKKYCHQQMEFIELVIKKIVLFDIPSEWTNSFMSRSAYGAAFLNCYQNDYDEVFIIDDISHQTGHVIFEALIYEREKFFKVDYMTVLDSNQYEDRTIEVFFHALFTYSLILPCLNTCHDHKLFKDKMLLELEGRILHSLWKAKHDLDIITDDKANYYFTDFGMELFNNIKENIMDVYKLKEYLFERYTLNGQPYNFTYEIFHIQNLLVKS